MPASNRSDAGSIRRINGLLLDISKDPLIDSGDLAAAEQLIVRAACSGLGVRRASIWHLDREQRLIRCVLLLVDGEGYSREPTVLTEERYPSYFEHLLTERTIAAHDARTDPSTHEFAEGYLGPLGITSMLDAPVRHRGEMTGIICCEHTGPAREWTLLEQSFAGFLADLVGRAMAAHERLRAEEELRAANQHLERRARTRAAELEEALASLREAQAQLIDSEKMAALGSLVAGVAHEVNTPVGVAVTAVSHLREELARIAAPFHENRLKRSELEAFLADTGRIADLLLSNLNRAAELVKGFKQVAVHQTSDLLGDFDVAGELRSVLISLHPEIKRRPVAVDLECRDGLVMHSYPGAFAQIVTNLVMNSLLHAFEGRESGRILLSAREDAGQLVLEYADDGCGVPEDQLGRIFEPFYTTRRGKGGTGLGLHIVYNLVTFRLKGRIRADSAPGRGLSLHIRVPLRLEEDARPG